METFRVYPALDLRQGQIVRLKEGDPTRQTTYSPDPAETARRWLSAGARWLHVVNLDGAFGEHSPANRQAVAAILTAAQAAGAKIQLGGGLRSLAAVEEVLAMGVERAILGTAAVENPEILIAALQRWGADRVAVSLDARDGWVQVRGWQAASDLRAVDLARSLADQGLRWVVYTDVARDGLGQGLNLDRTVELAQAAQLNVIASGGLRDLAEIQRARQLGLAGVIAGQALYAGWIDPAACFPPQEAAC